MKWVTFDSNGNAREVSGEEIMREWREADRAAGPKEGSRDWRPCSICGAGMRARTLYELDGVPSNEGWDCPQCGALSLFPIEHRAYNGLTRWQWSRVRHFHCQAFGHSYCLPDVWLDGMRVEGYRVVHDQLGWFDLRMVIPEPELGR